MEKNRQIKMMFIVALVLSVTAMTLGFAAFSSVLNISSSASVTPNSDDFDIRLVGLNGDNKMIIGFATSSGNVPGTILTDGRTVSGTSARLSKPGDKVQFWALLYNAGKYDAYFDSAILNKMVGEDSKKKCISSGENAVSAELLDEVCSDISVSFGLFDYDEGTGKVDTSKLYSYGDIIEKGKKYLLSFNINYDARGIYADGDFEVIFGNVAFSFSTVNKVGIVDFSVNVGNNKKYFNAAENMTWGEWVESAYNTDGFIISEGKIYYDLNQCICVSEVNPTDIILNDGVYSLTVEMTCDGVIPG